MFLSDPCCGELSWKHSSIVNADGLSWGFLSVSLSVFVCSSSGTLRSLIFYTTRLWLMCILFLFHSGKKKKAHAHTCTCRTRHPCRSNSSVPVFLNQRDFECTRAVDSAMTWQMCSTLCSPRFCMVIFCAGLPFWSGPFPLMIAVRLCAVIAL